MRYRLRTLLIVLAVLEFGLFMLPDSVNLPGGIAGWLVFVVLFWGVIPFAMIATLMIAALNHFSDTPNSRGKPN